MSYPRQANLRLCIARITLLAIVVCVFATTLLVAAPAPVTTPPQGIRENTPTFYALVGAKIVVSPDKTIESGNVVIRDGVIQSVGADVAVPAGARVIDLKGKTIYAGLIDAFTELPPEASKSDAALTDGVGAGYWNDNIVPQVHADHIYKVDAELNKTLRAQGIVARLAAPSTGIIKGFGAVVTTGDDAGTKSILRANATQHAKLMPTARRRDNEGYPDSPMGAFTLVRQALYDADWYARAQGAWNANPSLARPERNDALEALHQTIADRTPLVIDADDELYFLRADKIGTEFNIPVVVRGSGQEYRLIDAVKASGRTVLLPVRFPKAPSVTTPELAMGVSLEDLMDWDLAPENPAKLEQAGVTFALVSHSLKDTSSFLAQVKKAVSRGLTPAGALKALTVTPAKLLNLPTLGTVEAGKSASFVVTDGDLFAEKTKIIETWVDGKRNEFVALPLVDPRGTWDVTIGETAVKLIVEGENPGLNGKVTLTTRPSTMPTTAPTTNVSTEATSANTTSDVAAATAPATSPSTQPTTGPTSRPTEAKLQNVGLNAGQFNASFSGDLIDLKGVVQLSVSVVDADAWIGTATLPDGTIVSVVAKRAKDAPTTAPTTEPTTSAASAPSTTTASSGPASRESAKGKATSQPATKPAMFAANYPLGEFGRYGLPVKPKAVLFTNATVWTSGPQGVLKNASVYVVDGKIAAIGEVNVSLPDGAITIDCKGQSITPGLIDCHSHIASDGGINESGQAVTAEVRIGDFIDSTDINIYRILAGGVTTSNILHGSANPIGGQNQVIKHRWGAGPDALKYDGAKPGIKFALGENVKQSNWGDNFTSRYPQTRMGVDQIIRDTFQAAKDYRAAWEAYQANPTGSIPPRKDLELDTIVEILEDRRIIHCHSYRQDEILALIRAADDMGFKVSVFQHILEGYKVADAMKKHGAMGSSFADWWAYKIEVYDAIPYNGALMHNAGVVVSFNSDDAEMARRLNQEAAKAVKFGNVPPAEALKFVTLNPAKQLRIDDKVGSLEVGKDADLVVWSGDPLSTMSRVEQTWIDGRKYFDRVDDAADRVTVRTRRAALIQKILEGDDKPTEGGAGDRPRRPREMWPRTDEFDDAQK